MVSLSKYYFEAIETTNKNDVSKPGNMTAANHFIDSALLGMDGWIEKGNRQKNWGHVHSIQRLNAKMLSEVVGLKISAEPSE